MFVASIFLVFYLHRIFKSLSMYVSTQVVFMSIVAQCMCVCMYVHEVCGWTCLPEVNFECCSSETDLVYWERVSRCLGLTSLDRLPGQQQPSIFLSVSPRGQKTKPVPPHLTFVHGLRDCTEVFRLAQETFHPLNHMPSQLKLLLTWEPAPSL